MSDTNPSATDRARPAISVRDATAADVPALTAIKGAGTEAIHTDRLRDARIVGFRYLVLLTDGELVAFACLVEQRPATWSDAADTQHLPQLVDIQVAPARRGQGYGSALITAIEQIVRAAGGRQLYLAVEPETNPRAFALYRRLGYQPLQDAPYRSHWSFTDSSGVRHAGEDWIVDMVKALTPA